ncbi:amyloid-beta A4 precursor protein-binding family A member 1-like [Oscarella lobularis]|uniref:amyloid-beta A4 precursor protein-binding family A member 1-like n=1 Tax=Oscarella lobularis TaxID=121494 RepID=UPI0033136B01
MSEKIEAEASDDSNRRDSSSEGETKAADVPKPTVEKQDGSVEENANETEEERVDVVENEDENAARVAAKPEKAKSDDENEETERPGDDVSNGGGDDDEPSRRDALEPRLDENRPEEKNAASPVADSDSKPSEGRDTRSPSDHDEQPTATSQSGDGKFQLEDPVPAAELKPEDYINGVVFKAKYLGSTHLLSTQPASRSVRMTQAHEAVSQVKDPDGESQPKTDILLFVSTKRIAVFHGNDQILLMDHPLKAISYIADIGNSLVLMARRRSTGSVGSTSLSVPSTPVTPSTLSQQTFPAPESTSSESAETAETAETEAQSAENGSAESPPSPVRRVRIVCHVFESSASNGISRAIGKAFDIAYHNFLDSHGIQEEGLAVSEYADVLSVQKISTEDLKVLSDKSAVKEVIVTKQKGEILGVVLLESGWGSMVPTVVIAHMAKAGPLARTGRLNVGDQILSLNGTSLVGLPLGKCTEIVKACRNLPNVSLKVVSCPAVTQVTVFRPDLKYQLGFSVQGTTVCSILRGGIAERGGIRVGHQIIDINGISTVDASHQKIVEILSAAVGEISMKTMPGLMYRLLTGQETPQYI